MKKNKNETFKLNAIPQQELNGIARTILPLMRAYFENPKNKAKFEAWQRERAETALQEQIALENL